jgi:hypothetical protein
MIKGSCGHRGVCQTVEEGGRVFEADLLSCYLCICFLSYFVSEFRELSHGVLGELQDITSGDLDKRWCCESAIIDGCEFILMLLNGLLLLSNCCLNFRKLVLCDWLSSILSLHIRQDLPYVHGTHKRTELFGTVLVIQYRPVHMHTNIPATESGM